MASHVIFVKITNIKGRNNCLGKCRCKCLCKYYSKYRCKHLSNFQYNTPGNFLCMM